MNCEHVDLEPIEVERFQVKEVLKALLHSIIFQRALGAQQMRDTDSDLFDLSYVRSDSHAIDAKVEEQTEAFVKALERDETMAGHQVCLSFFELRVRPSTFGLFRSEEKVVWERWHIPLLVHARDDLGGQAERAQRSLALEACRGRGCAARSSGSPRAPSSPASRARSRTRCAGLRGSSRGAST